VAQDTGFFVRLVEKEWELDPVTVGARPDRNLIGSTAAATTAGDSVPLPTDLECRLKGFGLLDPRHSCLMILPDTMELDDLVTASLVAIGASPTAWRKRGDGKGAGIVCPVGSSDSELVVYVLLDSLDGLDDLVGIGGVTRETDGTEEDKREEGKSDMVNGGDGGPTTKKKGSRSMLLGVRPWTLLLSVDGNENRGALRTPLPCGIDISHVHHCIESALRWLFQSHSPSLQP